MKKTNAYNPKRKRVLTEEGEFIPFRADEKELEAHLNKKGQTLAQFKAEEAARKERIRKRSAANNSGQQEIIIKHEQTMTNDQLLAELQARGISIPQESTATDNVVVDTVVENTAPDKKESASSEEDFSELTVKELKALADDKGIMYSPNAKKNKLIELLSNDGIPAGSDEVDDTEEDV